MVARKIIILAVLVSCAACTNHSSGPEMSKEKAVVNSPKPTTASEERDSDTMKVPNERSTGDQTSAKFYHVRGLQAWGDYGDVLVNGYLGNGPDRREDEPLKVSRTGPFLPPITFPVGSPNVIVSDAFRQELLKSPFGKLTFRPVTKEHIVELHWEKWDRAASPAQYPDGGDPDDYLAGPHSPKASKELGELWELALRRGATVNAEIQFSPPGQLPLAKLQIRVDKSSWNGDAIFLGIDPNSAPTGGLVLVSDAGKKWLEEHAKEWVSFEDCSTN
jgi:hypothetical protein